MAQDNTVYTIISLIHQVGELTHSIYYKLHEIYLDKEIRQFWKKMADEKKIHIQVWEALQKLAQEEMLPQLFENPTALMHELQEALKKIEFLEHQCCFDPDLHKSFLAAYQVEFLLIRPAIEKLFMLAQELEDYLDIKVPKNAYSLHIDRFIKGLERFGTTTLEISLLGETLQRLWQENRQLAEQSNEDNLTHILNRNGFFQTVKPLVHFANRNQLGVGVLMIDIDHFKEVNDIHGHMEGDRVLREIASLIRSSVRKSDICGRYGGEEFIVFLAKVDIHNVISVAEHIRTQAEKNKEQSFGRTLSIGASGGQISNRVDLSFQKLIREADLNLLEAKKAGRNLVVGGPIH